MTINDSVNRFYRVKLVVTEMVSDGFKRSLRVVVVDGFKSS